MSGSLVSRQLAFASALRWMPLAAALAFGGLSIVPAHAQETVVASVAPPKEETENQIAPVCKTDFRLSGSVYDARHPERSFALVQFRSNERAGLVRIGSSLGPFQLIAIEPRGILLLDANGQTCWLRLLGDPAGRARLAATPAPPPPRPSKKAKKPAKPAPKKSEVVVIGHR